MSRRSAVVTGASKGLGRGIAVALAADGCDVVVNWSRSGDEAKETARAVEAAGGQAVLAQGDVADPVVSGRLAALALDAFGSLDVWVNNAGVSVLAPVADTPVDDMERMVAVNLMGTFHGLQAAAHAMTAERHGRPDHQRGVRSRGAHVQVPRRLRGDEVRGRRPHPGGGARARRARHHGQRRRPRHRRDRHGAGRAALGSGDHRTHARRRARSRTSPTSRSDGSASPRTPARSSRGSPRRPPSYVTGQVFLINGGSVLH